MEVLFSLKLRFSAMAYLLNGKYGRILYRYWLCSHIGELLLHMRKDEKISRLHDLIRVYTGLLADAELAAAENKEVSESNIPVHDLSFNVSLRENRLIWRRNLVRRKALSEIEDLRTSISILQRIVGKQANYRTESSEEVESSGVGPVAPTMATINENVGDTFGNLPDERFLGKSTAPPTGQVGVLKIQKFMDRPIALASGTLAIASVNQLEYDIWDLLSLQPSVRAKFKNFAYFRGTMRIRIVVSGSPFHYGRILVSYQPHAGKNSNLTAHETNWAVDPTYFDPYYNYLSQAPGACLIDVRQNRPVELTIPFISPKPMLRLYNTSTSAVSAVTSFEDFNDMGRLYFWTLNPIGSVSSGTSTPVAYQILGWFEDVELSVPTATNMAITTESRDERRVGPVEKISTVAASVAGTLSKVPFLAPFAVPSKIILSGISAIASWFGWSRPINLNIPSFVKNRPYANTTNCIGMETIEKLSLDPQMEIAVDGFACGTQTDEMVISEICKREAYIEQFTWASDDVVQEPLLLLMVHPQLNSYFDDGTIVVIQPSPMSFCASPFVYWRGDITYRLDFVTSQFHRGKFAVWYEPNHFQSTLISADLALNKNYVQIVDLAETNSIEFTVHWANSYPWLRTASPSLIQSLHNAGSALSSLPQYINGFIALAPFTELQSPDDSAIQVNVFVKSENIVFNHLDNAAFPTARKYMTESREDNLNDVMVSSVDLNDSTASMDHCSDYHFGETPVSFRALMKRYVTTQATSKTATTAYSRMYNTVEIIPNIDAAYSLTSAATYNMTFWSYLRYAYLGLRGCVRKRVRLIEPTGGGTMSTCAVSLGAISTSVTQATTHDTSSVRPWIRGSVEFVPHTNGGIEVELPWYNPNLFLFSFATDLIGTIATGEMQNAFARAYVFECDAIGTTNDVRRFIEETASGEDFTLIRFSGAPYHTTASV